ncbi:MAG: type II toxin-antitoxin system prevent-host-death family antitoxin [Chloroflexi bacterium]|nr:type II toxin-antitoxin system prevent-host-death family antitoxin [Chloroflexota bacterium]
MWCTKVTGSARMAHVTIREARSTLRALIVRAEAGEEIVILRRGKEVARLVPPQREPQRFPDLSAFRASIALTGEPASETVVRQRRDARY